MMTLRKTSSVFTWLTCFSLLLPTVSMMAGVSVQAQTTEQRTSQNQRHKGRGQKSLLNKYGRDLTELARENALVPVTDFDNEIRRTIRVLARGDKNNPVLIDDYGVSKNSVIEGLAQRIAAGDVPASMNGKRLISIDLNHLIYGTQSAQEIKERWNGLAAEISGSILFVDGLDTFIDPHGARGSAIAKLLQTAIQRGDVRVLGATTDEAYQNSIASNESFSSLFSEVRIGEETSEKEDEDRNGFVGDKVSPDLREMIANGKADESISVIMQTDALHNAELRALLRQHQIHIDERMKQLDTIMVKAPVSAIEEIASSKAVNYISPDREVSMLGHVTETTGTNAMRWRSDPSNLNLEGNGIGIAIVDSGIYAEHAAFKDSLSSNRIRVRVDFTGEGNPEDFNGHGTHVASLAAGGNGLSDDYQGIAKSANIISLRVLDAKGRGHSSNFLKSLDWILLNRTTYNIRVVNLSVGLPAIESYRNDPLCRAVRRLVDAGIVVVAAAGNDGKDANGKKVYGLIHSPGNEPSVITVGASNTFGTSSRADDVVTTYSSRGPTRSFWKDSNGTKHYDNVLKPDLVAPGNKLLAAQSKNNELVSLDPALSLWSTSDQYKVMYMSGTSMAAPIVSGTAALLLQANPTLTPNMVKMILQYTAQPLKGFNLLEQGAGQVNVEGAVRLAKLIRQDLTNSTALGTRLLKTGTLPVASSTISGHAFPWSQGIILNYTFGTGSAIITKYQKAYSTGVMMSDAVVIDSNGQLQADATKLTSVALGLNIMTSDGTALGGGVAIAPALRGNGVLMSDGIMMGDGVLMGDGVMMGDGVLMSDRRLVSDGVLMSDQTFTSSTYILINGDNTGCMR